MYLFESEEGEGYRKDATLVTGVFSCSVLIQGLGEASLCSYQIQMRTFIAKNLSFTQA